MVEVTLAPLKPIVATIGPFLWGANWVKIGYYLGIMHHFSVWVLFFSYGSIWA